MFVYFKRLIAFLFILAPIIARHDSKHRNYVKSNYLTSRELSVDYELDDYLASLKDIIGFCVNHKKYLDLNLAFGLFLINVHLKTVLNDENKCKGLPRSLHDQIFNIVSRNDQLLKYFGEVVMKRHDPNVNAEIMIATMFMDESKWIRRLPKFNTDMLNENTPRLIQFNKNAWKRYSNDVLEPDKWIPSPHTSDKCMSSLARSPIICTGNTNHCSISTFCKNIIMNGTDFGYALTHRLLMLQNAYFARGCSIFSHQLDKEIRKKFCATAYLETEFISMNDYGIVDLMLEIIGLCALEGHAQYLRSSWLKDIQSFQTPLGCYSETKFHDKGFESLGDKERNNLMIDLCNSHVTAVAAASLSAATRFLIETYY